MNDCEEGKESLLFDFMPSAIPTHKHKHINLWMNGTMVGVLNTLLEFDWI